MSLIWKGGCGSGSGTIYSPGEGISIQNDVISALRNPDNTYTKDEVDNRTCPSDVSPAENAHAVGEYLIYNNNLYRVIEAIAAGDVLVVDQNIMTTNIAHELVRTWKKKRGYFSGYASPGRPLTINMVDVSNILPERIGPEVGIMFVGTWNSLNMYVIVDTPNTPVVYKIPTFGYGEWYTITANANHTITITCTTSYSIPVQII